MSSSEYVANFFLVIIGFAVSEILRGTAKLIRDRRMIKFYWPYLLIIPVALELLMLVFLWIFTEIRAQNSAWTIVEMVPVSLTVIPLAVVSYLIFPSRIKEGFDLKQFYFDNAKAAIVIIMIQISLVTLMMLMRGKLVEVAYQVVTLVISALVLWKFEKLHLIWLISMIVLINIFIFFIGGVSIGG